MAGVTVVFNGINYWFNNDEELLELLDSNCDSTTGSVYEKNKIIYDEQEIT